MHDIVVCVTVCSLLYHCMLSLPEWLSCSPQVPADDGVLGPEPQSQANLQLHPGAHPEHDPVQTGKPLSGHNTIKHLAFLLFL